MYKTYKEIKPGDVFTCEYGDYENYVEVVFESNVIEHTNGWWLKTIGHYKNGDSFVGYSPIYNDRVEKYNVIKEVIKEAIN